MPVTNTESGTQVLEGAEGFSFNQRLVRDDDPLLFHTGPRRMFPLVREAVASVRRWTASATSPPPMWSAMRAAP
jgi:hypothetical protein